MVSFSSITAIFINIPITNPSNLNASFSSITAIFIHTPITNPSNLNASFSPTPHRMTLFKLLPHSHQLVPYSLIHLQLVHQIPHSLHTQTVGITLCVAGFGESMTELFHFPPWSERVIGASALILLALINIAGVKWVVRVQFILLLLVFLAVLDLFVGSFLPPRDGKDCRIGMFS